MKHASPRFSSLRGDMRRAPRRRSALTDDAGREDRLHRRRSRLPAWPSAWASRSGAIAALGGCTSFSRPASTSSVHPSTVATSSTWARIRGSQGRPRRRTYGAFRVKESFPRSSTSWPTTRNGTAVTNRGSRSGDEIVQCTWPPPKGSVPRPPKELKGFARTSLSPGETKDVSIDLEPSAFAYWDDTTRAWRVAAGTYEVLAGGSSADIRLHRPIDVAARVLPP